MNKNCAATLRQHLPERAAVSVRGEKSSAQRLPHTRRALIAIVVPLEEETEGPTKQGTSGRGEEGAGLGPATLPPPQICALHGLIPSSEQGSKGPGAWVGNVTTNQVNSNPCDPKLSQ